MPITTPSRRVCANAYLTSAYLAGYTYSKSLDNASGYGEQINLVNPGQYSLSSFNVAQNFVISYDYELPFYLIPGPSRLVKGWKFSWYYQVLDRQLRSRCTRWTIAHCWERLAPALSRSPSTAQISPRVR